jgi:hypothetical protein
VFFAGFLLLEKPLRVSRQFEKPRLLFEVGLIGGLLPFDLAQATALLGAPASRHPFEKSAVARSLRAGTIALHRTICSAISARLGTPRQTELALVNRSRVGHASGKPGLSDT